MSCGNPDPNKFQLEVSSSISNTVNFVLNDVVLLNLIFAITADIAGLVNSKSARDRQTALRSQEFAPNHILSSRSPPLVGVGLTCTRRCCFWTLAAIRAFVLLLILCTNFLIDGALCQVVRESKLNVVVPGPIPGITRESKKIDEVKPLMQRRRSCIGRYQSEIYYGELRDQHSCELRLHLMQDEPIFFSTDEKNYTISMPESTNCKFDIVQTAFHSFECPGFGVVVCPSQATRVNRRPHKQRVTLSDFCRGVVKMNDKVLICNDGPGLFPGRSDAPIYNNSDITPLQSQPKNNETWARCHEVRNFDFMDTDWTPLAFKFGATMRDLIDTYHGATVRKQTVRLADDSVMKQVSVIDFSWVWIVGAIVVALIILCFVDFSMRCTGLYPTANTEYKLGSLIAASALDSSGGVSNFANLGRPRLTIERQHNGLIRCRRSHVINE